MTIYHEVQADGLIGCSHNYAGLSFGNIASINNEGGVSKPRQAALQGLEKMRFVHELGVPQLILPPPLRPNMQLLERMNVSIEEGQSDGFANGVVKAAWSAATMWAANAATISPSTNTKDGDLHVTIANLASSLHRSQEATERYALFQHMFSNISGVKLHQSLPNCTALTDEGAANHMLLQPRFNGENNSHQAGIEIFVYGKDDDVSKNNNVSTAQLSDKYPTKYPVRQTLKASMAVANMHQLSHENYIMVQQHPRAINAGVFHNDVIAMSAQNIMIYHELSFANEDVFLTELQANAAFPLQLIRLTNHELPLQDAIKSYFYNSQLLSLPNGEISIIAPIEAQENPFANAAFAKIKADATNHITNVHYLDVRESMKNGGGPACLRLRLVMSEAQIAAIPAQYHFNERNYDMLCQFINDNYPEEITPNMLFNNDFAANIRNISAKLLELF